MQKNSSTTEDFHLWPISKLADRKATKISLTKRVLERPSYLTKTWPWRRFFAEFNQCCVFHPRWDETTERRGTIFALGWAVKNLILTLKNCFFDRVIFVPDFRLACPAGITTGSYMKSTRAKTAPFVPNRLWRFGTKGTGCFFDDVAASCCTDRDKPDGSRGNVHVNLENGAGKRNKICADAD